MVSNGAHLQITNGTAWTPRHGRVDFDRRFAWDKKLTPVDYA